MKTTFTRYLFQKYAKSILFTATFLALVFQGLGQTTENYDGTGSAFQTLTTGDTPFDYGGFTYQITEANGPIENAKISNQPYGQGGSSALSIYHPNTVKLFKIKKTDGGIFDVVNLWIDSMESPFTITGYKDGIPTTLSVVVNSGIGINELNFTGIDELWFSGASIDIIIDDFKYTLTNFTPTISINNSTLAYTENDAATQIDASGTVSDANGDADWDGGTFEVQITANNEAADEISIPDNVVGTINTSGTTILNATTAIGTLSASEGTVTNGTILTITFNASATNALVQQVLRALHYRNTSNDPGRSNRTITITATDKNAANDSDTRTIRVTAINDEPTLTATALDPTFTESGSAAVVFSSASASTIESGQTFSSFTMTVSNVNDGSYERLNLDGSTIVLTHGTSGTTATNWLSYSVSVSGTTATLSLSGGTLSVSALQTLINSISYQNNSNDPNTSNRVVTLTSLTDSGSNLGSNDNIVVLSIASTLSLVSVNDEPTLTATGTNPTFTENGSAAVVFSSASASTVESGQTFTSFTMTLSNVNDGSYERLNLDGSTIVLTHITSGTTATNSLSYSVSVSGTTATLSLSGGTLSTSALQTLINSISYQNNSNDPNTSNRVVTLTRLTDSGSNLGSNDNIAVLSITSTISVTAVNEVPTANDFTPTEIYQGTPYTFAASDFAYSDDNSDPIDHIRITAVPINGTLYVDANSNDAYDSGEELSNGSTVTKANLDAGNLQYINTGTSDIPFTFDVNDGIDYSTSSYSATLTIIVKPTVTLSLDPSSSISENGGTSNIKASLSHVFNKTVTVNLAVTGTAAGAGTDYNLSASSIVINSGSISNTISITSINNALDEDDKTIIADISTVTNGYEYAAQQVTCILTDDDVTGFTITETDGNTQVLESGTDDSFTVQLDVIPASDVVIDLANGNPGEIAVSPSSLTFTPDNWNVPQVVNLTPVDDVYDDGDQSVNITISINDGASDDAFDALSNQILGVTSVDDDTTGFSLSKLSASVTEDGSTDNISIALDARPASDVVLTISSSDETEATVLPAILTFTSENWSTEQVITLSGQDDALTDGNQISTITVSVDDASSDDAFDSLADQIVSCTTTDDEVADFIIVESVGYTHVNERGTSDVFSLRLAGAPLSDVVLSVSSSDTGEASVDKATLTFTSANWNTPQPVTVTGVNDVLTDGEQIVTITIAVVDASSHDAFDAVSDKEISVTNADDDMAGFTISQTNGSASVSENEYITLDTMWVVLNSLPSSNVVLSFVSSNEDEVLVDKYRYYYSPGNWNIPQRFLIGGMNDNFVDGDTTTPLTIGVIDAESPADYDLLPDQIINVINADNDVAAFSLSKTTATLAELGTETFTLHLANRPLSDVVFHISAGDSDEVLVSPSSLTFTTAEGWRSKKTITITGVDDSLLDGNQLSTITVSVDPDNSNDFFDALPDQTVTVTTTDSNVAALAIVESNGNSSLEETGSSDSFTVALRAQPDSDVVINIANADAGELSVTPANLTFTSANWNTPQTVSLTGVDDLFDDGAQFTLVTLSVDAANSDDLFDSMSNQMVNVITADDDSSPVITAIQSFSVDEDAANTTSVGTVLASDADAGTSFSNWTITNGNSDAVFEINTATGEITIADNTNLDFETTISYALEISVSDGTNTSLLETLSVTINDINDELPVVTASLSFSVDENAANTTSVGTVLASDADAGTSFSTWTIAGGNADAIFEINTATGEITIADNTNLDFETTTSYALEISVSDGTNTSLLETLSVTINDINDELPVVTAGQSLSVDENAANNASVGTVLATDADAGTSFSNWTIAGGNTDGIFEINTATGEITIADNTNLDFETTQSYALEISLSDGTNTSTVEDVIININDINDNTPVVTANQSFSVDENAANTTSVGTMLASDADAATSFSSWTIAGGNADAVFEINTATGEITIADNANLDFETTTSYALEISLSDGTNTSLLETLSVTINDINDELPVVTASLSFSVNENAANTASVGTVIATDADAGTTFSNWTIAGGNTDGIFEINTATGEITIADNSNLDFETTQSYALAITVSDGINTSIDEDVIININNINDNAPVVTASQSFSVDENTANTASVGTVLATDADAGTSFSSWTIISGNTDAVFAIDAATGEITIADNTNLDFETTTSYTLEISLSDGTNTSIVEDVIININDINDNTPVVTANQTFSVNENATNTASVGTVLASDADAGTSFSSWTIISGNNDAVFAIDAATGEITIADNANLDFESSESYALEISASDGTNTSAAETVIVDINDVNEAPTALAGENQAVAGEVIATLDGSASTDPEGDELSYYWTAPEGITLSDINAAQPTFTTPKLNETTDIEFSLIVNDGEFDSQESIVTVSVQLTTGINDFAKNSEIILYPNPSKGKFAIRLAETPQNGAMFTLSNLNGQIIHKKTIYEKETWFNLSLAPGLYLITIVQDNKIRIKKLLIQ